RLVSIRIPIKVRRRSSGTLPEYEAAVEGSVVTSPMRLWRPHPPASAMDIYVKGSRPRHHVYYVCRAGKKRRPRCRHKTHCDERSRIVALSEGRGDSRCGCEHCTA